MFQINRGNIILISLIAFIFYQCVNFIYFPISTTFPDEQRFLNEAIQFAKTGEFWTEGSRAWEMPLTAIVYGYIYQIFNNTEGTIIVIRVMQSLMLILQASLIYKIAWILFGKKEVAFISFVIMLFYPFFVYYQALLLSETIFITLFIISFYFLYRWYEGDFRVNRDFILTNIFLTLTVYSKGTLSILPPLLVGIFYFFNTYKLKPTIKIFGYSLIIYLIVMSSWWIRNYSIFDKFIPFTTSSSMNLYLGANEKNTLAGVDWSTDVDLDFVTEVNSLDDEIERSKLYKEKAFEFIRNDTGQYIKMMWLKFKRFYNFIFNAESFSSIYYNLLSIFSYGIVMAFALIAFVLTIKEWKKFSAIYIIIGYFTLIHIMYIASLRYRLPLEPLFILLASYSFVVLKEKVLTKNCYREESHQL